jgi:glycosyltransferase involved in cell wall biosynthesis
LTEILIISPSDFGNDPRVRRHVEVAKEFGTVTTCGYGPSKMLECEHLEIHLDSRFLPRNVVTLALIQLGFHRASARRTQFYRDAKRAIKKNKKNFDCVIANDVHAIQVASDLFPLKRIWVDMHEYAPREGDHDWRWRVLFKRHVKKICEQLGDVGAVSSVGRRICEQYEQDLGRKVSLLRNTSPYFDKKEVLSKIRNDGQKVHLVHVGVAIRARHLENMITAAQRCPEVFLHLYILPTDRSYFEEIEELCRNTDNVLIETPVAVERIIEEISQFDAGVIAIPPTSFNYENGLPNKLFQYIQARLPVISGPLAEIAEIVIDEGIGIVAEDFCEASIVVAYQKFIATGKKSFEAALDSAAIKLSIDAENVVRRELISEIVSLDNVNH